MTDEQPMSRRAARDAEAARAAARRSRRTTAAGSGGAAGAEPGPTDAATAASRPSDPATEATTPLAASGGGKGSSGDGGEPPKGGIGAVLRRHPAAWLAGAIAVVFALLGTGAVFAGVAVGSPSEAAAPVPTVTTEPPRPIAASAASRVRTCSVAGPASDPRLMSFEGTVLRADTGEVLFDRNGAVPARTASVLKTLTAAAALAVLGPDHRITTSVTSGASPGSVVLIGRGDATLSRLPVGQESVYRGAPKLADLAQQVIANYRPVFESTGEPISSVVLDASYWSAADKWDSSWKRSEQTIGYHSEVTALQIDGDRQDPTRSTSPRSTDPIARAGEAFVQALRDADTAGDLVAGTVTTSTGTSTGGAVLGEVQSQPVRALITYMLQVSDNTLAEMLARIVSKESGMDGSAASLQQAIPSALSRWQFDANGVVIRDGSGLSDLNAVPALAVAQLMIRVQSGDQGLETVRDGLPISGQTGSLASRFGGANADARGQVHAKTGWIDTEYSLAGFVDAADGTRLTFAFYAIGDGIGDNAKEALDTLTAAVFRCGDNLSNS